MTGWLTPDALQNLLSATDVFALPSLVEGLPVSVLEAMSYGIPCVVSAVGGLPDVIESGENGLLVAPGDSAGLADALALLIGDDALRARMGSRARRDVIERYSLDVVVDRLTEVYEAIEGDDSR